MSKRRAMAVVHSWDELPKFRSEKEEADFWATHSLGDELLEGFERVSPEGDDWLPSARPRTKPIGVRFDESTLGRLKTLAGRRHKGYQSLLKEFVVERLYEEEKREGLVGSGVGAHPPSAASRVAIPPRPDSDLTATGANKGDRRRTINRPKKVSLYTRRTSANVRGRKKPGL